MVGKLARISHRNTERIFSGATRTRWKIFWLLTSFALAVLFCSAQQEQELLWSLLSTPTTTHHPLLSCFSAPCGQIWAVLQSLSSLILRWFKLALTLSPVMACMNISCTFVLITSQGSSPLWASKPTNSIIFNETEKDYALAGWYGPL